MSEHISLEPERSTYIAPGLTTEDWKAFAQELVPGDNNAPWAEAFDKFLLGRLESRYLKPICTIRDKGGWEGEGFTIVSIQCALIEFLAATRKGRNYRHQNPEPPHEYNNSKELFTKFLADTPPFNTLFSLDEAMVFYSSIRCALLHEARTKDGWKIWVTGSPAVDPKRKIVFRDSFQEVIRTYIHDYGLALTTDGELQAAFKRKFNDLAA